MSERFPPGCLERANSRGVNCPWAPWKGTAGNLQWLRTVSGQQLVNEDLITQSQGNTTC